MRLEIITWDDAAGYGGWQSIQSAQEKDLERCLTVGWVVAENERFVSVVQSRGAAEDGEVDHIMVIPKGMIVERRTVDD